LFPLGKDTDHTHFFAIVDRDPARWKILLAFLEWDVIEVFDGGVCAFLVQCFTSQFPVQYWRYRWVDGKTQQYWFEPAA
jgi:hypothetical protein